MNILKSIVRGRSVPRERNPAFSLAEVSRLGLSGLPTAVAYDPAQSLLAIGTSRGSVLITGKGWEYLLPSPENSSVSSILFLTFKVGDKYLIALTVDNELIIWNLQKAQLPLSPVKINGKVTNLDAPSQSKWIYVGLEDGTVMVYDSNTGKESPYRIPYQFAATDENAGSASESMKTWVTGIQTSPTDSNLLLISYAPGFAVLWDLKEQTVRRKMRVPLEDRKLSLDAIAWHPDGQLIAGNCGSRVAFWDLKEGWLDGLKKNMIHKPLRVFTFDEKDAISVATEKDCNCIPKLIWSRGTSAGETLLIATDRKQGRFSSLCLRDAPSMSNTKFEQLPTRNLGCIDICLMTDNDGNCPATIVVTPNKTIRACYIGSDERLELSPSLQLASGLAIADAVCTDCSEYLGWEMAKVRTDTNGEQDLPLLLGGTVINKTAKQIWDLICTVHPNGILWFWQASVPARRLFALPVGSFLSSAEININTVWMDLDQRFMIVNAGEQLLLFRWIAAAEAKAAKQSMETPEDTDELMKRLDATVDEVLKQSEEFSKMVNSQSEGDLPSPGIKEKALPDAPASPPLPPRSGFDSDAAVSPPLPPRPKSASEPSSPLVLNESDATVLPTSGLDQPSSTDSIPQVEHNKDSVPDQAGQNAETPVDWPAEVLQIATEGVHEDLANANPVDNQSSDADEMGAPASAEGSKGSGLANARISQLRSQETRRSNVASPKTRLSYLQAQGPIFRDSVLVKDVFPLDPPINEYKDSLPENDYVIVEPLTAEDIPEGGGWYPLARITHKAPVRLQAFAAWADLLVTTTDGGRLHVTQLRTGREVTVEPLPAGTSAAQLPEPDEITLVHIADTYFERETVPRTCIFVGTASGTHIVFGVYYDLVTADITLRKSILYVPRRAPQRPMFIAVLDDHGRVVRQARPPNSAAPPQENYVILAFSHTVVVQIIEPDAEPELLATYTVQEETRLVVKAGLCTIEGDPKLVLITAAGVVQALELPGLKVLWEAQVPLTSFDESRLRKTFIAKDGRLLFWSDERELRMFRISSNTSHLPDVEIRMYDLTRAMAWARAHGLRIGSATTNSEHDALFRSPPPNIVGTSSSSSSNLEQSQFGQTKQALNERGEKLGRLEEKFGDLADSSKTFLDAVREYNERQERKKWWQL